MISLPQENEVDDKEDDSGVLLQQGKDLVKHCGVAGGIRLSKDRMFCVTRLLCASVNQAALFHPHLALPSSFDFQPAGPAFSSRGANLQVEFGNRPYA